MSTMVSLDEMPGVVSEVYSFLLDDTEVEPTVERNGYGRMLLAHQNERVRVTISFRLTGRSWSWIESKLFIDGVRVKNANSWDMYVAIFKDPDNGRKDYIPKGAKKAKVPASRPVDQEHVPGVVAEVLRKLRKDQTAGMFSAPRVSIAVDQSRYLIEIDSEQDGGTVVALFKPHDSGSAWVFDDILMVNRLGYDITASMGSSVMKHLLKMMGAESRANQVTSIPGGRKQSAAVTNSTEVRKATVFRV